MAALTGPTTITEKQGAQAPLQKLSIPVAASTVIYSGAIVVVNAGYAEPATTDTGLLAVGRAEFTVDNSAGAAGALSVSVERGAFAMNNSASTDLIAQADLYKTVYLVDDNTAAKTDGTGTRSAAGKLVGFNDAGRPVIEFT